MQPITFPGRFMRKIQASRKIEGTIGISTKSPTNPASPVRRLTLEAMFAL